ncbi:MAG: DUF4364 family protein [Clostridia bacterium]|nr:DUF4364 family protein [Clostridia bacterium]
MAEQSGQSRGYERRRPEAECRLIVLLLLKTLGPVSDAALLKFCADADSLAYFELMPALSRLCREGQAVRTEEDTAWRYALTEAGEETLDMFAARIPASDRERIEALAPAWREKLRKQRSFVSEMKQTERGDYQVTMRLSDHDMDILELRALVASSDLAAKMTRGWETAGEGVYEAVLSLLRRGETA